MEEKDIEYIDHFLNGSLSEAETAVFRQRLAADKEFAQLYEDLKYIQKGLQRAALEKAWETIQKAEAGAAGAEEERPVSFSWKLWLPVAASLAILLVAAWFFLMKAPEEEVLFAQYFEVYPNVEAPIYRDSSSAHDSLTTQDLAFRKYAADDFEGAIQLFESIESKDEGTRFYLGISYLANGEAEEAANVLLELRDEAAKYKTQAEWFLALAFIKDGKVEQAKEVLEVLAVSGTAYEKRSKELLDQL